ncbi:Eukaryotic translation initiation factor 4E type 2 [Armadillidium vulgare]|nr:Eukaryotic translation initiation factor 4E type 2 [Armadillidium vulgare]
MVLILAVEFSSVEQFWAYYCHLTRPSDLTTHSDIHIFRDGIKPMWEDPANKNGGKWIVRFRKGLASRCWENLLLAMVGEQFMVGEEICGAVISVRFQGSHELSQYTCRWFENSAGIYWKIKEIKIYL